MFEWIVMFVVVETGIQPLVHTPSGRKLVISRLCTRKRRKLLSTAHKRTQIVISRLCTPQADANWLSAVCAPPRAEVLSTAYHLKRAQNRYQPLVPQAAQIGFSRFALTSGRKWLSTACAHLKRAQNRYQPLVHTPSGRKFGYQPFVHLTSGRKLVINRLCTPQAGAKSLSTACAHSSGRPQLQQKQKAPEPAQILRFQCF